MNSGLVWSNLVTYSLQVGLLVGLAAFVPTLLRLRVASARLAFWHALLVACMVLPLVRPWRQAVVTGAVELTVNVLSVSPAAGKITREIPWTDVALGLLAVGIVCRLAWLGVGLWRLRQYRRNAESFLVREGCPVMLSEDVCSPVTFGAFRPVVLLPVNFRDLDGRMQEAVLCHELLHVERHDWLYTVVEELVRAVLWFHPAIWWLLGEIQLAREQAVDQKVVERTQARDEYVDALLAIAGATPRLDLAPAPLFLRKRHLKQRVVSILKEVRMSQTRLISGLAAGMTILAAGCWLVTSTFPLAAAPQVVNDAPGVAVEVVGATLIHRTPVAYPPSARAAGVQGVVTAEAVLDSAGSVTEVRILSGPPELRKAVQQSVLQWHFTADAAGSARTVNIRFEAPQAGTTADAPKTVPTVNEQRDAALQQFAAIRKAGETPQAPTTRTLGNITFRGLSDSAVNELRAKLPVRTGETLTVETMGKLSAAVAAFDEHLRVSYQQVNGQTEVTILAPEAQPETPTKIRIGGNVQQMKLVQQPHPVYPPDAKAARVQGQVKLQATIGFDGTVKQLEVISGDPLLVAAAMEAVKQWVYQPTLLNGNPVEVVTQIDVNFTLSQ